ncbi:MAG: CRTAC1 family protein [Bacteroidetes bacterium]|nr:CRTAC1 family protein [Bacteroidota bacterium]
MNTSLPTLLLLILLATAVPAQDVLIQRDNGTAAGAYFNRPSFTNESVILAFDGPCRILELHIYYMGDNPAKDTLYVVGDAAEGAIPPTHWVWGYNTLTAPIVVDYSGTPGWHTIDLRDRNLRCDGLERIVMQHWTQSPAGPWFAVDNDQQSTPYWSFLMDPTITNSLGGPGQFFLTTNDFMVRALVRYDYPDGNSSQPPPAPTLKDVAVEVGIHGDGNPLTSAIAAVADWDNDGWDDINIGSNYFRNRGDGTFERVIGSLGLPPGYAVWADFDNDGWVDAYIVNGGDHDKLVRNNGDGTFTDVTTASGISNPAPTVTPIWLDYNNDGHPDLFIANGRRTVNSQEVYFQDRLWRNNGDGTFTNVTVEAGIAAAEPSPYMDCWGASACDYNNDGLTDIFVSTYRLAPDLLYRNNGDGTFTEVGAATGVRGVPTAVPQYFGHGMGSDWGDFNNDGLADLVVGNLGHPDWRGAVSNPSLIFRNDGSESFTPVHQEMGLKFREMNAGVTWVDLDCDGWLDLWQSQYAYNREGVNGEPGRYSRVYINSGAPDFRLKDNTWHFGSKVHGAWTVSRIDFDNDGDIDLLVASPRDGVKLFRNDIPRKGRWLAMRLSGSPDDGVPLNASGTRVVVHADGRMFTRTLSTSSAGSRAATNSMELHFGLGPAVTIDSVVLHYPNGTTQTLTTLVPDKRYHIAYTGDISTSVEALPGTQSWSVDAAELHAGMIHFNLQAPQTLTDVRIDIYSLLGRRIHSISAGELHPGYQSFFLPMRLSSGLYLLSLQAGGQTHNTRMVVTQ